MAWVFKNFILLLFVSAKKDIKTFKYNFDKHIEEILEEILFITEFISSELKNNEILNSVLEQQRIIFSWNELENFRTVADYNITLPLVLRLRRRDIIINIKEEMPEFLFRIQKKH